MQRRETGAIEQFQTGRYIRKRRSSAGDITISQLRLDVQALSCERGGRLLFEAIGFTIRAGEMLVLTGPNGAGKSSLLRLLAGLLQPAGGTVALSGAERRDTMDYLGHADGLRDALSVGENLAFRTALLGAGAGIPIAGALERLDIAHLKDLPAGVLSAGQRRRVALAGLLAAGRPVWLLDEPTTALDSNGQTLAAGLMAAHLAAGGLIVAATHQPLGIESAEFRLGGAAVNPAVAAA